MIGRRAILAALLGAALALPGCDAGIRSDAESGLENGRRLTAAERARMRAVQRGELLREEKPFYGAAVEVERGAVNGTPLPRRLEGARGISLRLGGQADVETVAAAITAATDVPVNIRTRYVLEGGEVVSVPIGTRMAVNDYEGALSAFLDRVSARMDVAWSYDGAVVTIDRMTRRTWRIALPLGTTEVSNTLNSDRGLSVTNTSTLDPWSDLEARLEPLAPPPARVTLAPAAGRVEVFGPPTVQKAVGEVLEDVAATARMRIGLDVAVYFIDSDRADEFGMGMNVTGRAGEVSAGIIAAATGQAASGLILSRGDDVISFEALARDSTVLDYRLASSVAQSGVFTPIALTEERSYIRNVTRERADDNNAGTTTYEIAELKTGLAIAALARLVEDRQIQLALVFSQRALRGFDQDVLARTGTVQAPTVDNREIRNQTVLSPGETLVLSGYEQDVAIRADSGLGFLRRLGVGGGSEASRRKVRMVIFVRPTLIPSRGQGGRT